LKRTESIGISSHIQEGTSTVSMQGQPAMSTITASTLSKLSEAYESPVYLSPTCTPHGMTNKKSQNALHEAFQNMLITLHLALSPSTSFDKKKAKATCPTPC